MIEAYDGKKQENEIPGDENCVSDPISVPSDHVQPRVGSFFDPHIL